MSKADFIISKKLYTESNVNSSKKLSICMFSNLFPPIVSGSSTFTWELSRRLVARGHKVSLITAQSENSESQENVEGIDVYRLPAIRLPQLALAHNFKWMTYTFTPKNISWLINLVAEKQFDIIHQQNHIFDTILSSSLLVRKYKIPLILTIHTFAQHPNKLFDCILSILDVLARKVIFEKAKLVVSPDSSIQKYVEKRHHIKNSPIIPYGIEIPSPDPNEVQALSRQFNLGDKYPVILSLGHVNLLRDRADIIQAMPVVLKKFPNAQLLIVGAVDISTPLQLVKQLKLENHVTFTGALPHNQVVALFALSTMEAHTANTQYPGPGIATMEAMASGLPVITGEIDKQYDFKYLQNWENLVMVTPNRPEVMAKAILQLLEVEGLCQRIGGNARRTMAEFYSWEAVCSQYESVYYDATEKQ